MKEGQLYIEPLPRLSRRKEKETFDHGKVLLSLGGQCFHILTFQFGGGSRSYETDTAETKAWPSTLEQSDASPRDEDQGIQSA